MAAIKHNVWQEADGSTALYMAGDLGKEAMAFLARDAKIIYSFFADSHFDAMTKYYQLMDWGVYNSEFEEDKKLYDIERLQKRASLIPQIETVLWNDWDPAGINDIAPADEYQHYVPQILNMVMGENKVNDIAEKLYFIETIEMDLEGDRERCYQIARKLIKLR